MLLPNQVLSGLGRVCRRDKTQRLTVLKNCTDGLHADVPFMHSLEGMYAKNKGRIPHGSLVPLQVSSVTMGTNPLKFLELCSRSDNFTITATQRIF